MYIDKKKTCPKTLIMEEAQNQHVKGVYLLLHGNPFNMVGNKGPNARINGLPERPGTTQMKGLAWEVAEI